MKDRDSNDLTPKASSDRPHSTSDAGGLNSVTATNQSISLQFPRLAEESVERRWQPVLVGEGTFPADKPLDAARVAQEAIEKIQAGILRLHSELEDQPAPSGPQRAA